MIILRITRRERCSLSDSPTYSQTIHIIAPFMRRNNIPFYVPMSSEKVIDEYRCRAHSPQKNFGGVTKNGGCFEHPPVDRDCRKRLSLLFVFDLCLRGRQACDRHSIRANN